MKTFCLNHSYRHKAATWETFNDFIFPGTGIWIINEELEYADVLKVFQLSRKVGR